MIAFGPIPSRRLGRSLGINNIPPKNCTYACVYCQVGKAINMGVDRQHFYDPDLVIENVEKQVKNARKNNEPIDYLSYVPDGEPTLDVNLGSQILGLKKLGIPIAVITNGTLLMGEDVRKDLMLADWVSLKIDSTSTRTWKRINKPYKSLDLSAVMKGMQIFSNEFNGTLTTETMLIRGINDTLDDIRSNARFISTLGADLSYLSVPTRPPAESGIGVPDEEHLNAAFQVYSENLEKVELLVGYEGTGFAYTGNIREDILSIAAVHPIRQDGLVSLLDKSGSHWELVEDLIREELLTEIIFAGQTFYVRKLKSI